MGRGPAPPLAAALSRCLPTLGRLPGVLSVDPPVVLQFHATREGLTRVSSPAAAPCMLYLRLGGTKVKKVWKSYKLGIRVAWKGAIRWGLPDIEGRFVVSKFEHPDVDDDGLITEAVIQRRVGADSAPPHVDPTAAAGPSPHGLADAALCRALSRLVIAAVSICDAPGAAEDKETQLIKKYAGMRVHKQLFNAAKGWDPAWFAPDFLEALYAGFPTSPGRRYPDIFEELLPGKGLFAFDLFTPAFCETFLEEIDNVNASGLPTARPNSMNNYGVVLERLGMGHMIDVLISLYLKPVSQQLFSESGVADGIDHDYSFTVRYAPDEDLGLDMHTDDSEVTFNVCLGRDFEGAGLQFCGIMGAADHRKASYRHFHKRGRAVVHLGVLRHGADDITSGERQNLILWLRSSEFRRVRALNPHWPDYAPERVAPDPVCVSFTHDRDYGHFKMYTERNAPFRGKGWCPPRGCEYADFRPENQEGGQTRHRLPVFKDL